MAKIYVVQDRLDHEKRFHPPLNDPWSIIVNSFSNLKSALEASRSSHVESRVREVEIKWTGKVYR